jgi:hypothetical protein
MTELQPVFMTTFYSAITDSSYVALLTFPVIITKYDFIKQTEYLFFRIMYQNLAIRSFDVTN